MGFFSGLWARRTCCPLCWGECHLNSYNMQTLAFVSSSLAFRGKCLVSFACEDLTLFWMCLNRVGLSLITYFSSKNPDWKWLKCCLKSFSSESKQRDVQCGLYYFSEPGITCFLFVLHLVLTLIGWSGVMGVKQELCFQKNHWKSFYLTGISHFKILLRNMTLHLKYLKCKGISFTINITVLLLKP